MMYEKNPVLCALHFLQLKNDVGQGLEVDEDSFKSVALAVGDASAEQLEKGFFLNEYRDVSKLCEIGKFSITLKQGKLTAVQQGSFKSVETLDMEDECEDMREAHRAIIVGSGKTQNISRMIAALVGQGAVVTEMPCKELAPIKIVSEVPLRKPIRVRPKGRKATKAEKKKARKKRREKNIKQGMFLQGRSHELVVIDEDF